MLWNNDNQRGRRVLVPTASAGRCPMFICAIEKAVGGSPTASWHGFHILAVELIPIKNAKEDDYIVRVST